jgi:hypothetical protein
MTKMLIRALFDPNGGVEAYLEQLCIRKPLLKRHTWTWRNGRRKGLKIPWEQSRAGSSPTVRTTPHFVVANVLAAQSWKIRITFGEKK